MGSFAHGHFSGPEASDLYATLTRTNKLLHAGRKRGSEGGLDRLQTFALFQIWDAYRLGVACRILGEAGDADVDVPPEALEVISRKILEHAILLEYVSYYKDESAIERFRKTSANSFEKAWEIQPDTEGARATVKELPSLADMAKTQPVLYKLYRRLSHNVHARTARPQVAIELQSGKSRAEYFAERRAFIFEDVAMILTLMGDNAFMVGLEAR